MAAHGRAEAHKLWTTLQSEHTRFVDVIRILPLEHAHMQEDMRRYLCLRCAGFLEQVVYEILTEYLRQKCGGGGPILEFSLSFFTRSPNLTPEAFEKLLARFGQDHIERFRDFMTGSTRESLEHLMSVRNPVAHGQYMGGVKLDPARYMELCQSVYDWMLAEFLGNSVEVLANDGMTIVAYENVVS